MTLFWRYFLGYCLVLVVSAVFLVNIATDAIKPAMRQSSEEALVDVANLLAEVVVSDVAAGALADGEFARALERYAARRFDAVVWDFAKTYPDLRVYITDAAGIVLYDSAGTDVGADYSRWNDVFLTLRGEYGARTSPVDPAGSPADADTVMHVAAPVRLDGRIVGALAVAKPNLTVQPLLERSERNLYLGALLVLAGAFVLAWLLARRHAGEIAALGAYADAVAAGDRAQLPTSTTPELSKLGCAVDAMRTSLEGKAYVEQYAEALTHELKSPLAAIIAAVELLRDELTPAEREHFLDNVSAETTRMQQVIERLLDLAVVEHRRELEQVESIDLAALCDELVAGREAILAPRQITIDNRVEGTVRGERFLLGQAIANLLDNAIGFSPDGAAIGIDTVRQDGLLNLQIADRGPGVPDFAVARVTERFFSLPRPGTDRKGTGLGLSFVAQVALLHGGTFSLLGREGGGAVAILGLPGDSAG